MVYQSRGFRAELFTNPIEYEETPLRDRKADFPCLVGKGSLAKKTEFLRDFIALANTARLFGQSAYLLYGIGDDGIICGIDKHVPIEDLYGPLDEEGTWEKIRKAIGETVHKYVKPVAKYQLKVGNIHGAQVAYLVIEPVPSDLHFQARESLPKKGAPPNVKRINAGDCWLRFGANKEIMDRDGYMDFFESPYQYAYTQAPYVPPSAWLKYFENLMANSKIKSAQDISAYQELQTSEAQTFTDMVEDFLGTGDENLLVIVGHAGSGKSACLRRLVADWAESGQTDMNDIRSQEEFAPPPNWIPVYFELRNRVDISDQASLAKGIIRWVNKTISLWEEEPIQPELLLEVSHHKWLICFDGLDEIWNTEQQEFFLGALRSFQQRYPRIKIILTTRPDISIPSDLGHQMGINNLSQQQVIAYIGSYVDIESQSQYQSVLDLLETFPELWKFCTIPAYLEALKDAITNSASSSSENVEMPISSIEGSDDDDDDDVHNTTDSKMLEALPIIDISDLVLDEPIAEVQEEGGFTEEENDNESDPAFSLGWILSQMFDHLWKRERDRRLQSQNAVAEWWDGTGNLALWMAEQNRKVVRKKQTQQYLPQRGFQWILSLRVLQNAERRTWYRFFTDLTQLYFAAEFVLPFLEYEEYQEVRPRLQQCQQQFRNELCNILQDLTYRPITPLFQEVNNE